MDTPRRSRRLAKEEPLFTQDGLIQQDASKNVVENIPKNSIKPPTKNSAWIPLSFISGLSAALASVFAKMGLVERETIANTATRGCIALRDTILYHSIVKDFCGNMDNSDWHLHGENVMRFLSLILVIVANVTMWLSFTSALSLAPATLHASVVNSSTNFVATAVFGALLFMEKLTFKWFIGATFIVTGSILMNLDQAGTKPAEKEL